VDTKLDPLRRRWKVFETKSWAELSIWTGSGDSCLRVDSKGFWQRCLAVRITRVDGWVTLPCTVKTSKAILVTSRGGHSVLTFRPPQFVHNRLTDGGEVISLRSRPILPLPPRRFLVFFFVRGWVDYRAIVWLDGSNKLENQKFLSGIELATFRLNLLETKRFLNTI
jgi:hypothetical protein